VCKCTVSDKVKEGEFELEKRNNNMKKSAQEKWALPSPFESFTKEGRRRKGKKDVTDTSSAKWSMPRELVEDILIVNTIFDYTSPSNTEHTLSCALIPTIPSIPSSLMACTQIPNTGITYSV
jgi:hypothetical protein